jgi:phosphotransferase system enzyme I (PtsI)
VLRLIHTTLRAGNEASIPVAMCGEMAGDVRFARLLLGLGLRRFSVHPASLLEVKKIVLESDIRELSVLAQQALKADSGPEVALLLEGAQGAPH